MVIRLALPQSNRIHQTKGPHGQVPSTYQTTTFDDSEGNNQASQNAGKNIEARTREPTNHWIVAHKGLVRLLACVWTHDEDPGKPPRWRSWWSQPSICGRGYVGKLPLIDPWINATLEAGIWHVNRRPRHLFILVLPSSFIPIIVVSVHRTNLQNMTNSRRLFLWWQPKSLNPLGPRTTPFAKALSHSKEPSVDPAAGFILDLIIR